MTSTAQTIEQFDLSRATLRRGIESGRFPKATKDKRGRWTIPVDDLVAAHITSRKTWLNEHTHEGGHPAHHELDTEKRLREAAETNTNDLRMIEAARQTPPQMVAK